MFYFFFKNKFKQKEERMHFKSRWISESYPRLYRRYVGIFPVPIKKQVGHAVKTNKRYTYRTANFFLSPSFGNRVYEPSGIYYKMRRVFGNALTAFDTVLEEENKGSTALYRILRKVYFTRPKFKKKKKRRIKGRLPLFRSKNSNRFLTKKNWYYCRYYRFKTRLRVTRRMRRKFRKNKTILLRNRYRRLKKFFLRNKANRFKLHIFFMNRWWYVFRNSFGGSKPIKKKKISWLFSKDASFANFLNEKNLTLTQLWLKFKRRAFRLQSSFVKHPLVEKFSMVINKIKLKPLHAERGRDLRRKNRYFSNLFFLSKKQKIFLSKHLFNNKNFEFSKPLLGLSESSLSTFFSSLRFKNFFYKYLPSELRQEFTDNVFTKENYKMFRKNSKRRVDLFALTSFLVSLKNIKYRRLSFKLQKPYLKGTIWAAKASRAFYRKNFEIFRNFKPKKVLKLTFYNTLKKTHLKKADNLISRLSRRKIFYWYFTSSRNNYRGQVSDSKFNIMFWATSYTAGKRYVGSMARNSLAIESIVYKLFSKYLIYLKKNRWRKRQVQHVILLDGPIFKFKKHLLNIFSRRKKKLEISQVPASDKKYIVRPRYIFSVAKVPFNGCFNKARRRRKNRGRNKWKKKSKKLY